MTLDELTAENRVLRTQLKVLYDQIATIETWITTNNKEIGKQLEDMRNGDK